VWCAAISYHNSKGTTLWEGLPLSGQSRRPTGILAARLKECPFKSKEKRPALLAALCSYCAKFSMFLLRQIKDRTHRCIVRHSQRAGGLVVRHAVGGPPTEGRPRCWNRRQGD